MSKSKTIIVAMSGGVDSSVSALLLKEQGYNVKGLFMQNWQNEADEECTSEIDFKDASEKIGIDIEVVNFAKEYKEKVFSLFISGLEKGITPNPDILCNSEIKFEAFLNHAIKMGASKIATGHYANLREVNNHTHLIRAKDRDKDQTYFLHEVKEEEFKKCIFPLANLTKPEVREIAIKNNLSI